jgi:hypothetical protein
MFGTSNYNITNITTHLGNQHKNEKCYLKDSDKEQDEGTTMLEDCVNENIKVTTKSSSATAVIIDKCCSYLYKFFNTANIAIQQADNVHLQEFIEYLIENGGTLKGKNLDVGFSRYKYKKQELMHFHTFISFVKLLTEKARSYYLQECNAEIPFLCVSHDGWDSKDHDVLGVSIHFVVPVDWVRVNIAIGLQRVDSKTSKNTVDEINKILSR